MVDQITGTDFCGLCGHLLSPTEEVTCSRCDDPVIDIMTRNVKTKRLKGVEQLRNGTVVCRYKSISLASKKTGITISSISRACKGQLKSAGGYAWNTI